MSRKWLAGLLIYHYLGISVVGTDKHYIAVSLNSLDRFSYACINCFDSLYRRSFNSRMTNHVGICEVDYYYIVRFGIYGLHQLIAHLVCAHLRLKIIRRNLWRRNKYSFLALIRLLDSAVEEERNMSVLLCLGYSCLRHIICRKELSECVIYTLFFERHIFICDRVVIISKANVYNLFKRSSLKAVKSGITKYPRYFTCPVRTEVEEYNGIVLLYFRNGFAVFIHYGRENKFVRNAFII